MTTKEANRTLPNELTPDHIAVAYLAQRFQRLSKEAAEDLASLAAEFSNSPDEQALREIIDTMKEILFPELIGNLRICNAGEEQATEKLKTRMRWIGEKIKIKRLELEMTQDDLATKSGLPQSHISRLEHGQHSPSHRTLERIAEALQVQIGDLDPTNP